MNTGPIWITTSGFLITATELVSTSVNVVASGINTSYRLISGKLPNGLSISTTGTIYGTPLAVVNNSEYSFVIRATSNEGIADRLFKIDITGPQNPVWNTSSGYAIGLGYTSTTAYLKLGPTGESFTLNRQYVNYQFLANPANAPADTKIRFYIGENGGTLPPGLFLNQDGILSGFLSDDLVFDGTDADTGGYDEEVYDGFSYDHGAVLLDSIGVPKIYQFRVTASDGVASTDRFFKVLVVSPEMVRNPSQIQMTLEPGIITGNPNYLPPLQFVNGTDLGVARAENNETFDVSAYNGYTSLGTVSYSIIEGADRLEKLPNYLTLDTNKGIIYGYIPYQPAYTENYKLTIAATRSLNTTTVTAINTFTLAIKGEVESTIEWVSSSTLGIIYAGRTSELSVEARQINSEYSIEYKTIGGTIPPGLTLQRDGSLSGSVTFGSTGTYTFSVKAQDVHELSAITRTFNLTVLPFDDKSYSKIYVKPFLHLDKRTLFREFMTDSFIFPQKSIYRFFDPNFGVQTEIKLTLEFNLQQQNLADYVPALRENFYRRRFYFGEVKLAVAKTSTGTDVYEVVYVDIIDNMIQNKITAKQGSVSKTFYQNNQIYYPNSIDNMRYQLRHLTLNAQDFIGIDDRNLPLFMKTAQAGDYRPVGYMHVMPLCYTLPGEGKKIISRIKLSGFDFKQFDLDIDRLIIDQTLDNSDAKYLLFPRQSITDEIEADNVLYVFDESALETDLNAPINRE